jgi:NADPH:quinone reductase
MRAVIYEGAGGPEVITIGEVPKPEVGKDHIRVRVHAAGVNRADLIQRRGQYAAPPGWPSNIPGLEYAGEVEAVRPGVTQWRVGDRVMGLVGGGAQAELVVVHQDEVLPIPAGLSYAEAAAIPEVFLTAYDALVTRGRLESRGRVLIHAVGSGLGTAAAFIYSVVATLTPDVFPSNFMMEGRIGVYFEAAAVIISLTLLGQMLELKARSQTSAIR